MANIQAALNSMLSSAASGAFIATQTPEYKKAKETTELKRQEGILTKESEALTKEIEEAPNKPGTDPRLVSVYERSKDLDKELYENQLALYKQTGNEKYLEESFKYSPSQRKNWDELIEEERNRKITANQTNKANTFRNQLEALAERRDILSAKERGQLKTMLGRHKEELK